ncbi:hypothetical protein P3X46_012458, partial [Hevea brasiliensis]
MIDIPLLYNFILGRLILNDNDIVTNMQWLCMKLPAPEGIAIVRGSQKLTLESYKKSTEVVTEVTLPIELLKKLKSQISPEPVDLITEEELEEGRKIHLETTLSRANRE